MSCPPARRDYCRCCITSSQILPENVTHFTIICLAFRMDLHSLARLWCTRASHSVNKRRVGFAEVVGISFYVPWLLRTTTMKTSSIETI